jgi:hypothetical protein
MTIIVIPVIKNNLFFHLLWVSVCGNCCSLVIKCINFKFDSVQLQNISNRMCHLSMRETENPVLNPKKTPS